MSDTEKPIEETTSSETPETPSKPSHVQLLRDKKAAIRKKPIETPKPPPIGEELEVHIEGFDSANGLLLLPRKGAAIHANWESVAVGQTVEARVTETNKGGLGVVVNNIRGFMPISQIELFRVENIEP